MQQVSSVMLSVVHAGDGKYKDCFCLQGRFSGRLQSKADEAGLLVECPQLGPLLGGSLDPEVCRSRQFTIPLLPGVHRNTMCN